MKSLSIIITTILAYITLIWAKPQNWWDTETYNYVNQIKKLNFYKGVDVSSIISLEESGVKFYSNSGREQDIFQTLKDAGVNCIRVRVWNNPRSNNGKTYGGGNNDIEVALKIGKRAAAYGIPLFVDFHYSDFWADPGKQTVPKAWNGKSVSDKGSAIYYFTYDSLKYLLRNGVLISMVQVGNETNSFMCGEKNMTNVMKMMVAGSNAVRDINRDILVVLHFTNPDNYNNLRWYASQLKSGNVDYDVFASSYYPYWHGTLGNLKWILEEIGNQYNKKVMVAEFSYPYTDQAKTSDNCNYGSVTSQTKSTTFRYQISVNGQIQVIKDIFSNVRSISNGRGIGAFYWEPAWISPKANNDWERKRIWEEKGSSWATTTASEYDSSASRTETGGTSWDNQALFDQNGRPLNSLYTFNQV